MVECPCSRSSNYCQSDNDWKQFGEDGEQGKKDQPDRTQEKSEYCGQGEQGENHESPFVLKLEKRVQKSASSPV
jgi:hypothetical protein